MGETAPGEPKTNGGLGREVDTEAKKGRGTPEGEPLIARGESRCGSQVGRVADGETGRAGSTGEDIGECFCGEEETMRIAGEEPVGAAPNDSSAG